MRRAIRPLAGRVLALCSTTSISNLARSRAACGLRASDITRRALSTTAPDTQTTKENTNTGDQKKSEKKKFEDITMNEYLDDVPAKFMPFGRIYATGRRKTSVARVFLSEGSGRFVVNGKDLSEYFQPMQRNDVMNPLLITESAGLYDIESTVKGGGINGQAGALRLGISRCLELAEPGSRFILKPEGYLTRDSRRVERKKPGQKKARKKFQWVKR